MAARGSKTWSTNEDSATTSPRRFSRGRCPWARTARSSAPTASTPSKSPAPRSPSPGCTTRGGQLRFFLSNGCLRKLFFFFVFFSFFSFDTNEFVDWFCSRIPGLTAFQQSGPPAHRRVVDKARPIDGSNRIEICFCP
jgi:hypothetical protein